jgi:hypothetical protein
MDLAPIIFSGVVAFFLTFLWHRGIEEGAIMFIIWILLWTNWLTYEKQ